MLYEYKNKTYYMEKAIADVIDRKIIEIKDDNDAIINITGGEGLGKSTFAQILGGYFAVKLNTQFSIDNIFFDTESLMEYAEQAPKHTVLILDESRADLYRGSSNSNKNKRFTHWLSECRSRNLILIFLIPSIHDFDPYVNKWRLSMWFEITKLKDKKGIYQRGYFHMMGIRKRKVFLRYLQNKYSRTPKSLKVLRGKFQKDTPINKIDYENKKDIARKEKFETRKKESELKPLTPRQIDVLSRISPAKNYARGSADYEMLKKLVNSLKKLESGETGNI